MWVAEPPRRCSAPLSPFCSGPISSGPFPIGAHPHSCSFLSTALRSVPFLPLLVISALGDIVDIGDTRGTEGVGTRGAELGIWGSTVGRCNGAVPQGSYGAALWGSCGAALWGSCGAELRGRPIWLLPFFGSLGPSPPPLPTSSPHGRAWAVGVGQPPLLPAMGPWVLLLLGAALPHSCSSALDVDSAVAFEGPGSFGLSVAQSDDGVLVGAPLDLEGRGRVYRCRVGEKSCRDAGIGDPPAMGPMALGMSMAANGSQLLACGPTAQRMCGENAEVPGFCFLLFSGRSQTTTPRACPTLASDIVFLMDGSGSVADFDFHRMKTFIIEVIKRFRGTDTRFAVVQFSTGVQRHVDFSDFDRLSERDLERRVNEVQQSNGITQTATAIRIVLTHVFTESRAGANKVLIVVTDGQMYGDVLRYSDVIPQAERAGVVRYAIGVGSAFKDSQAAAELQTIASAPPQAHVFRVDNFEALRGIQEQLQEKIFAIEGTRPAFGSSFQLEMAQEGFSALLTPEGAVLGAVGAYDWAGGVFIYGADGKVAFVNASEGEGGVSDAYLGYATESLSLGGLRALVLGAPRYRHVGRLLLFVLQRGGKWELRSDAVGRQVGSYFGAALCALEGSGDGAALLVGVPMFYGDGSGGRVEVCMVLPQGRALQCHQTLRGQAGHPLGRFGASVARLGDIDGDGLHDVAVGAPMEDDERGAIYIFRGEKGGVSGHYSQRIAGSIFHSAPQHFGQALSGGRDLTGDRLPDVAVGAQGQVLLLRSPPLLKVEVTVTFTPPEIPISDFDCHRAEEEPSTAGAATASTANVCFVGTKKSSDSLGSLGATLHYRLELDPGRAARAVFSPGVARSNGTTHVGEGRRCQSFPIRVMLPFEKNCGEDNQCVPDLRVALSFSGLEELVVGVTEEVTVTVTVHNVGEDAYGAHVELQHPKALSYRKATALQPHRRSLAQHCSSVSPGGGRILCNISHPVLWAGQQLVFAVTMDVPHEAELGDAVQVVALASSVPPPVGSAVARAELPALYSVVLLLTSSPSSTRSVSAGRAALQHRYRLSAQGARRPPGSATIRVPAALRGAELWEELQVEGPQACNSTSHSTGVQDPTPLLQQNPVVNCSVAACREWRCPWGDPLPPGGVEFSVSGRLRWDWVEQLPLPHVELQSSAQLQPEGRRYRNVGRDRLEVRTELRPAPPPVPLGPTLGAVAAGLLLAAAAGAALHKHRNTGQHQHGQQHSGDHSNHWDVVFSQLFANSGRCDFPNIHPWKNRDNATGYCHLRCR
ncbi:integrin alpha-D isoform X4 [Gallus gallus]|uniref:integrin alpha-D isoform X4 n=1 Tax=Gallus gallus TaxID=9031 RepID=UPI000D63EB89|nr:integrin alpha-D isoform X4 [Gallus gallus]|eukprot:XP_025010950.1 integrin alpha-D isoform X4 [Gallus gallus]